jgi:hypothetical protein
MMTQFDANIVGTATEMLDILKVLMLGGAVTDWRDQGRGYGPNGETVVRVTVVNSVFVDLAEIKQAIEEAYGVGKYDNAISLVNATIVRSN